jgi:hypothetical protein
LSAVSIIRSAKLIDLASWDTEKDSAAPVKRIEDVMVLHARRTLETLTGEIMQSLWSVDLASAVGCVAGDSLKGFLATSCRTFL